MEYVDYDQYDDRHLKPLPRVLLEFPDRIALMTLKTVRRSKGD